MTTDRKITVLIADDSLFMRGVIKRALAEYDDIEIVAEASDGLDAIKKAFILRPTVITMDFNMPKYNGAQATAEILSNTEGYRPGIVMFSAHTQKEAHETLESLRAGAVDFITKPSGELSTNLEAIKDELVAKIKAAAHASIRKTTHHIIPPGAYSDDEKKLEKKELVVIGASTGGPPLIEDILTTLPLNLKAPIIVCQHMPKAFTAAFAQRLDSCASIKVTEAQDGDILEPGAAVVLPGDTLTSIHRTIAHGQAAYELKIEPYDIQTKGPLISINTVMTSAAALAKEKVLGIILSGMGEDGLEGMHSIKDANGQTIAQEPNTAVIDSMPSAVINDGCATEILTPTEISQRIIELCT